MLSLPLFCLVSLFVSALSSAYYTPCSESTSRLCSYGVNVTERYLNLKRGGSQSVLKNTYESDFYLCEEYNYNCGYLEEESDFLTIGGGMQLNMTSA